MTVGITLGVMVAVGLLVWPAFSYWSRLRLAPGGRRPGSAGRSTAIPASPAP